MSIREQTLKQVLENHINEIEQLEIQVLLGEAKDVAEKIGEVVASISPSRKVLDFSQARLVLLMAKACKDIGRFDEARTYVEHAKPSFSASKDCAWLGDTEFVLCALNRNEDRISEAVEQGKRALELYKKSGDNFRISRSKNQHALIFYQLRLYDHALVVLEEAIEMLGNVRSNPSRAEDYQRVALASSIHLKAVIHLDSVKHSNSARCQKLLKEADDLLTKPGYSLSDKVTAFRLYDKGRFYFKNQENSKKALTYFERSLALREGLWDRKAVAHCLLWIAKMKIHRDDIQDALNKLRDAGNIAKEVNSDELLADTYKLQIEAYIKRYNSEEKQEEDASKALKLVEQRNTMVTEIESARMMLIADLLADETGITSDFVPESFVNELVTHLPRYYKRYEREIPKRAKSAKRYTASLPFKFNGPASKRTVFAAQLSDILVGYNGWLHGTANKYHCHQNLWNGKPDQLIDLYEGLSKSKLMVTLEGKKVSFRNFTYHIKGNADKPDYNELLYYEESASSLLYLFRLLIDRTLLKRSDFLEHPLLIIFENWNSRKSPLLASTLSTANSKYRLLGKRQWKKTMKIPAHTYADPSTPWGKIEKVVESVRH